MEIRLELGAKMTIYKFRFKLEIGSISNPFPPSRPLAHEGS